MQISVAMATYNGARYLPEQLNSLAEQTLPPAELVVCDDRSTDDTRAIVESFAANASFPVHFQENLHRLHFADNFLKAASLCTSEYIAFCDQDDVWLPDKLEQIAAAFNRTGVSLVAHNASMFTDADRNVGHLKFIGEGVLTSDNLFPWNFFFGFTCTFRRDLLDLSPAEHRPIDLIDPRRRMAHDRWITFLASTRGAVVCLPEELTRYRQHDSNESGWMRSRRSAGVALSAARHRFGYNLAKHLAATQRFVEILEEVVARSGGRDPNLVHLLDRWRSLETAYSARLSIAEENLQLRRLAKWLSAVTQRSYHSSVAERPIVTLVRDLTLAILARPHQREQAQALLPTGAYPRRSVAG